MPNEKVINTPRDPYQTTTTGSDQRFRSQQPNIGNTLAQDLALIPNLDPEISRLIKGYLPFITLHEVNIIGGPVGKPPNFRPDLVIHNPKDPEKIQKTYVTSIVYAIITRSISSLPDDIGTIFAG
ncbi:retrotransposon tca3 polyprotein, putative [Candida dubliniensis CD36]|uniref:Retrotransposon tca3 polyprotein, putative n=1 Tax=Candida dubliniensis (strain CD36 / ATCC MYA-646 / CBS 7987 / NCPF 3949 / NRRL Y-17841) TaxID=573826 RepID=B9WDG5_CANDC|nr:retrotransposon tca3 polyprotein, putative [Candida dubliniensis CD36]CAX42720.1 retrotransposon tca3 polyprotein, putative [Candida dubliniensis CD36]